MVNYFLVNERLVLMDLPGYGYARVHRSKRAGWGAVSERAWLASGGAALTILLVDSRRPPTEFDHRMADWLSANGLDWLPVLTKSDKLKASEKARMLDRIGALPGGCGGIATSSRSGLGIAELWRVIHAAGASPRRSDKEARCRAGE
jgi:GTP-binding protein